MPGNIEHLLVQHLPALRAFVRLRCGAAFRARESASDLVQSVCRELLEEGPALRDGDESMFRRWLFVKALDKVRDRCRYHLAQKRDVRAERAAPAPSTDAANDLGSTYATILTPSRIAISQEEIERIECAFDALPEHYREVVTLARFAGLTAAAIAEQLGTSEKAVHNILFRASRRLSWLLSEDPRHGAGRPEATS